MYLQPRFSRLRYSANIAGRALRLCAVLVLLCVVGPAAAGAGAAAGAAFPGSRLVSSVHGAQLNSWANQTVGQRWELCYTSFGMNKTAAEFHRRCDQFKPTITVAHNSLNYTFGGFVRLPVPLR